MRALAAVCLAGCLSSAANSTQFIDWASDAGGAFTNPANWSPMQVPGPTDWAYFNRDASYTVFDINNVQCAARFFRGAVKFESPNEWFTPYFLIDSAATADLVGLGEVTGRYVDVLGVLRTSGPTIDIVDGDLYLPGIGRVEVQGPGMLRSIGQHITVDGDLRVHDGGRLESDALSISSGYVWLSGAGTIATIHAIPGPHIDLSLFIDSSGEMRIEDGAVLVTEGDARIQGSLALVGPASAWRHGDGEPIGPCDFDRGGVEFTGDLELSGGASIAVNAIVVGLGGPVAANEVRIGGPLAELPDTIWTQQFRMVDATLIASSVNVLQGGTLRGDGHIMGDLVSGGAVSPTALTVAEGTPCPHEPGLLNVDGAFTQLAAGELVIHLGGRTAPITEADSLGMSGPASLAGTLDIRLGGMCVPTTPHTYTILTASDIDGEFETVLTPALPGWVWEVEYLQNVVLLHVKPQPIPGDIDGDSAVTFADLNILLGDYGAAGSGLVADLTGDGAVDFDDLNLMLSYFGLCWQ